MNRTHRLLATVGAALVLTAGTVSGAFAWTDRIQGRPENLHAGGDLGYYFWHDEDGLHLRTTGPGPRHVFHGTLRTAGEFRDVQLVRLEGDDGFVVHDGGHVLEVRFETWDGIDGIDFKIEGGHGVHLALNRDGDRAPTSEIHLGADSVHPQHNPMFEPR